jgi:hypothetical protein
MSFYCTRGYETSTNRQEFIVRFLRQLVAVSRHLSLLSKFMITLCFVLPE